MHEKRNAAGIAFGVVPGLVLAFCEILAAGHALCRRGFAAGFPAWNLMALTIIALKMDA